MSVEKFAGTEDEILEAVTSTLRWLARVQDRQSLRVTDAIPAAVLCVVATLMYMGCAVVNDMLYKRANPEVVPPSPPVLG